MSTRTTTRAFYDPMTGTVSYVVWDPATRQAAVIDPVLDFDFKSGRTSTTSADAVLACLSEEQLQVDWILETHAHADHLSAARYLQGRIGGRIAIGENIRAVQAVFKKIYNLERAFLPDGSQFDHLFKDGETFRIGEVEATALLVPGHTPADMAYLVDGKVFVDIFAAARRRSAEPGVPIAVLNSPDPAWLRSFATLAASPSFGGGQALALIDGYWSGAIEAPGQPRKMEISLTATPSGLVGQRTSRQGKLSTDMSLQNLSYSRRELRFSFTEAGERLNFAGRLDGDVIAGEVTKASGARVGKLNFQLSR